MHACRGVDRGCRIIYSRIISIPLVVQLRTIHFNIQYSIPETQDSWPSDAQGGASVLLNSKVDHWNAWYNCFWMIISTLFTASPKIVWSFICALQTQPPLSSGKIQATSCLLIVDYFHGNWLCCHSCHEWIMKKIRGETNLKGNCKELAAGLYTNTLWVLWSVFFGLFLKPFSLSANLDSLIWTPSI